jgi:hypothetical protein
VEEDGLGLIVQGVAEGDGRSTEGGGLFAEEAVAETAGGIFNGEVIFAGIRADVAARVHERKVQRRRDRADVAEVCGGFGSRAELVVEVGDTQFYAEFRTEAGEQDEERGGVGAARDSDDDFLAGG